MDMDLLFELSRQYIRNKYKKYIRTFVKDFKFKSRFSVITGQRGVGKTTALIQLIRLFDTNSLTSHKVLYIPCDHIALGSFDIYQITEEFVKQGGKLLCLDEIHKTSKWASMLKSIYETFPEIKCIASGSSLLKLKSGESDLARRVPFYKMPGFSFREYIELRYELSFSIYKFDKLLDTHEKAALNIMNKIEDENHKILRLFSDYLYHGYFPYYNEFNDNETFLNAVEQDARITIDSDLLFIQPELSGNTSRRIHKLLSIISESVPFTPDLSKLRKAVDISDDRTLKTYLIFLDDAGLIRMIHKGKKSVHQLTKPSKLLLDNPNLQYALTASRKINAGILRETFFSSMIINSGYDLFCSQKGDFNVNNKQTIEIGGKNKNFSQISKIPDSYLFLDNLEQGRGNKIPLWLAGFLY